MHPENLGRLSYTQLMTKKKAKDDVDNQQGAEDGASIVKEERMKYLVGEGAGKGAEVKAPKRQ